ncbi:conserved hypothetical protein, partial [Ricinus communis]
IPRRRGDQIDRVVVAIPGRIAPADDSVTGEHDTAQAGIFRDVIAQAQAQIEARSLPRQPAHQAIPDLVRGPLAGRCCRQRDDGVRMHMIDMGERQKAVQRRVDGGRARIQVEGAVRQITHHFIFVLDAAVELFEAQQLIEVYRRETIELHRADVAAGTLHPQHGHGFAGKRIDGIEFRGGIAAAEIGDGEIGTQQIGAIQQQLRGRQRSSALYRPAVLGHVERQGRGLA